jgi:hypothetical protein
MYFRRIYFRTHILYCQGLNCLILIPHELSETDAYYTGKGLKKGLKLTKKLNHTDV